MEPKIFFSLLFLSCFNLSLSAQYDLQTSDTSKKKVRIADESNNDAKKIFDDNTVSETPNMVKVNITHIASAEFLLSYERMLGKYFGIEVAAGPTYYSPLMHAFNFDYIFREPEGDMAGQAEASSPGTGHSVRLGGRFYFEGEDYPESWFVGLEARNKRYNHILDLNVYGSIPGEVALKQRYAEFYLLGGYHMELYHPIYFEYNFGLGLRNRNLEYVDYTYADNGDRHYFLKNEKASYPYVTAAFKAGVAF